MKLNALEPESTIASLLWEGASLTGFASVTQGLAARPYLNSLSPSEPPSGSPRQTSPGSLGAGAENTTSCWPLLGTSEPHQHPTHNAVPGPRITLGLCWGARQRHPRPGQAPTTAECWENFYIVHKAPESLFE